MRITRLTFALIASLVLLTGCETVPPLSFSVPNVGVSTKKIDAELKSMTVTVARPDEKKGNLPLALSRENVPALWQTALIEALNRMTIFQDDASKKVNISVKILSVDVPSGGASFTTETVARYEIMDRKSGDIIFTQDISSSGTTPFDYAFMGVIRARESVNRAVQNNISLFLQALETVDITKPMFPANSTGTK
jgi:hypothetical protein